MGYKDKEVCVHITEKRLYISWGYNWRRFALGISIDRYAIGIDFLFFWFGIEL